MESKLYSAADFTRALNIGSKGAVVSSHDWRSPFRRDYARLLHCPSLRRLQGKMQLFAGLESDFFRNRLTHSMEVAQIAKSIALKLNVETLEREGYPLNTELVEFAGLAHDLGHPPFGHAGEYALNQKMADFGGFEGNAQTLRILSRLEKKLDIPRDQLDSEGAPVWFNDGIESSVGLNLCFRTLASVLKYDKVSEARKEDLKPDKGYYSSESDLIKNIKNTLLSENSDKTLRTIECQIMDLSDDIAYSTYDIEDSFKAGLLEPLDLFFPGTEVLQKVADRTRGGLRLQTYGIDDVQAAISRVMGAYVFPFFSKRFSVKDWDQFQSLSTVTYQLSKKLATDGFARGQFTSWLVDRFMSSVTMKNIDQGAPMLSEISIESSVHEEIEVLKHLVYLKIIESNRMKAVAYRATYILNTIFDALIDHGSGTLIKGHELLPDDFLIKFQQAGISRKSHKKDRDDDHVKQNRARVVADFIAGMTDRYAVEFYGRLTSENFQTIFRHY